MKKLRVSFLAFVTSLSMIPALLASTEPLTPAAVPASAVAAPVEPIPAPCKTIVIKEGPDKGMTLVFRGPDEGTTPVVRSSDERTTLVDRSSVAFREFSAAAIAGKLDLTRIVSDRRVRRLNLYQMTRMDCFNLGLQTHDWKGKAFLEYRSVEPPQTIRGDFIAQLRRFPHLKELIFRGKHDINSLGNELPVSSVYTESERHINNERLMISTYTCSASVIDVESYCELNRAGYKVTLLNEGDFNDTVDWLFHRYDFTEEQCNGLIRMASLLTATDDPVLRHPGAGGWEHIGPGRLALRIYQVIQGTSLFGTQIERPSNLKENTLHRAIAAYTQMTQDDLSLRMFVHDAPLNQHGCRGLDIIMSLIRLAGPEWQDLLETVVSVHNQRLYYGAALCSVDRIFLSPILKALKSITHQDTPQILKMMRTFIPDFTAKDLEQGESNERHDYGSDIEISEIFPGAKQIGLTRRTLFLALCKALGEFDQPSQLARLTCLFSVLELQHIQATKGLEAQLQNALRYIYDNTRDINATAVSAFLETAKASDHTRDVDVTPVSALLAVAKASGFNPLLEEQHFLMLLQGKSQPGCSVQ